MKGFIEQMIGKCGYIVIMHNEPAQCVTHNKADSLYTRNDIELHSLEKDSEKAQWKLNAFWQRCGYRHFKNYENVFICNVDRAVAEQQKAKATAV
jgi:hypothetical protein